jgi:UDP-N-acetylglucosamine 3-dehydrogenase
MSTLKVGLVGLGIMGKNHARVLSKLEGVELLGIVDPLAATKKLSSDHIFYELKELLGKKPNYCVIAAPTGFHRDMALEILNAGVNCLIEKPVAINLESANQIKKVASSNSLVVGIGHIERYNSGVRQLKSRLLNGDLGEIYQVSSKRQGPFPSRIADVGVVRDLGTHDIDLTMWLTNSTYESVSAHTITRSKREFEDMAVVNGKLKNEVLVNMIVNWLSPFKERSLVVTGERGAFMVDTLSSDLKFYKNGSHQVTHNTLMHFTGVSQGDVITYAFDKPEPLVLEHENFRDFLIGKKSEIVTLEEGIETVKVSDGILESAKIGMSVKF